MLGCPPIPGVMARLCKALGATQSGESQAWSITMALSPFEGREFRAKTSSVAAGFVQRLTSSAAATNSRRAGKSLLSWRRLWDAWMRMLGSEHRQDKAF